ncbi:hypothetical protein RB195_005621 [Necator americanus]|uniref:inositol-phosphate phosphatase n=1 Tax=Necator americanus TaxID=51031 RepID=A0ABR1BRQ7_NECAM
MCADEEIALCSLAQKTLIRHICRFGSLLFFRDLPSFSLSLGFTRNYLVHSMDDDDDVIIIEESFSSSFTRRSAPLGEIEILSEPGDIGFKPASVLDREPCTRYEKLQQVEQLIARAKANSVDKRTPKITVTETRGVDVLEDVQNVCEGKLDEVAPRKRRRKKEPSEAQLQKQQEKKRKAIEREQSAAINTKCEQYMYCHVSRRIFDNFSDTELHTRMLFMERNIQDQLICDEDRQDMRVLWHRKCVDAVEADGGFERQEYEVLQHIFAVVLSTDTFKELVKSNGLEDFAASQKLSYSVPNSTLVLIIYGRQSRNLFDLSISLFDCYRTQLHYVHDAKAFAMYLAQISRALAKRERHLAHRDRLIVNVEKGVKDAEPEDLIRDWWDKMLAVIARLQDTHRRAIVSAYPNPMIARKKFLEMGYKRAVQEIAEIRSETGRRLGPAMAHRLFMILTDTTGEEPEDKYTSNMQVRLHARNTFAFIVGAAFIYLAYLIFFKSGDGIPEIDVDLSSVVSYAVLAAEMGGYAVRKIHEENKLNIAQKGLTDEGKAELLTKADLVSNYLILDVLQRFPRLKIVTEEKDSSISENEAAAYRTDSYSVWLSIRDILAQIPSYRLTLSDVQVYVDPLDATQEYTEGLTEYVTVMVCIAVKDEPIFGAIYRPFSNETIFGVKGWGVMTSAGDKVSPKPISETAKKIVVSRSHAGAVEKLARRAFGDSYEVEAAGGSGYKTLRLVNGTAEIYIHQTAIKKWDTCAGDAILRALGGAMLDLEGSPLQYGLDQPAINNKGLIATVRTPFTYSKSVIHNLEP